MYVDNLLVAPKFGYEDLRSLAQVFDQNYWFFTWDLISGYFHVDTYEPHQTGFLGIWIGFNGITKYFVFTVLPFGLSNACYCFAKVV